MARRRRNIPQQSTTSTKQLHEVDDRIASITQLWTLSRATLLLLTPILASTILQVAPKYVEPIYGNVFSTLYFPEMSIGCLVGGAVLGVLFAVQAQKKAAMNRLLAEAVITAVDRCGIIFASAPILTRILFNQSGLLGPYIGPQFTQSVLGYPVMFLLGFVNAIVCARRNIEIRTIPTVRWISYVATYTITIVTLTYVLYNVMAMGKNCQRLYLCGTLLGVIGGLFKSLLALYGEVTLLDDSGQRKRIHLSAQTCMQNIGLKMFPQVLIVLLALYNVRFIPQCHNGLIQDVTVEKSTYSIIARKESITGWIDIVDIFRETPRLELRLMRAGHSFIGGVYKESWDSVYGSFYFMEAVRLVEERALEGNPTALQIGLGIGVSAASLQNANITLDIVELDPAVYEYAIDYFKLEKKHNIYIQDGRRFIENAPSRKYNYVLHDVFTGGSVPSSLFSTKALEQIKRIMKDDGILALNFVGSQLWPYAEALALVYNTIRATFPYVKCVNEGWHETEVFTNMAFFASSKPIRFRDASEMDFFGSATREYILKNFQSWFIQLDKFANVTDIITEDNNPLDKLQLPTALEHWKIMRSSFPLEFWINY
ncbi:3228_t:CDS:2 [Paraglomus occultum]|uniref:3228_t:CDS:1 n=1 Tax=Paraglomus occultum TaxID=144539 RepID=A0A9N8ZHH6_9GLOM|nr:3228_t:CDS:2 [Paraglomus occultum]